MCMLCLILMVLAEQCFREHCCLSIILLLNKGNYPENLHVVFYSNKQHSFEPFMRLDLV